MSDPYFNNVTLLLHCDGSDGSTTFTDVKGHTVTPAGNAQIDTAQSKFGGASALFDGAGDYLSVPHSTDFEFGSGDWTVEFWYRPPAVNVEKPLIGVWTGTASTSSWCIETLSTNIYLLRSDGSGKDANGSSSLGLTANVWQHIAVVRSGTSIKMFKDGVQKGGGSVGAGYTFGGGGSTALTIAGTKDYYSNDAYSSGHLDDIRITKGIARYTADFTPADSAFSDTLIDTFTISATCSAQIGDVEIPAKSVYAGSLLSKADITVTSLIGAALQKSLSKTSDAGACIGAILTRVAFASAAELGVERTLTASSDFMIAGREYALGGGLLQKALSVSSSTDAYATVENLTLSCIATASFASFKRCYINSAVQGTSIKTATSGSALQKTLTITAGASSYLYSAAKSLTPNANSYLQKAIGLSAEVGAYMAKQRNRTAQAGAAVGAIYTKSALVGAALKQTKTKTANAGSLILKTITCSPLTGAALSKAGLTHTAVAGAYLVADAGTETLVRADCEWTAQPRQVEWVAAVRDTEWTADARPVEWIASGCGDDPQWTVTVRTSCSAGAYLAAA